MFEADKLRKGSVISVPQKGVMKAVITSVDDDGETYYRIVKHRIDHHEGHIGWTYVENVVKGVSDAFELMVHGSMSEETYTRYIAEQRNIFKRIKRKYKAIKRRVRG